MKGRKRAFRRDILIHCYQRTIGGGVLFYCVSDFLICFTIICITALRYKVRLYKVCLMYDHIHLVVSAESPEDLSRFIQTLTSRYALAFREMTATKGNLFVSPFGSSLKKEPKHARSVLIYADNNPVERQLCRKAEQYRWNFLAYAFSDHPFSEKRIMSKASAPMRRAVRTIQTLRKEEKPLSYALLKRLFTGLNRIEKEQLTDFIVVTYSVIDYEAGFRFFGSADNMLQAIHSTTGNDYDLKEVFVGKDDTCYRKMAALMAKRFPDRDIHFFLSCSEAEKLMLFRFLRSRVDAPPVQIAKFLHMPVKPRGA